MNGNHEECKQNDVHSKIDLSLLKEWSDLTFIDSRQIYNTLNAIKRKNITQNIEEKFVVIEKYLEKASKRGFIPKEKITETIMSLKKYPDSGANINIISWIEKTIKEYENYLNLTIDMFSREISLSYNFIPESRRKELQNISNDVMLFLRKSIEERLKQEASPFRAGRMSRMKTIHELEQDERLKTGEEDASRFRRLERELKDYRERITEWNKNNTDKPWTVSTFALFVEELLEERAFKSALSKDKIERLKRREGQTEII